MIAAEAVQEINYIPLPSLQRFHEHPAQIRCIVGPVGSGKTTAATWELCYYLPMFLYEEYGIRQTRWVIVRNTYSELIDTTQKTVFDWFGWGVYRAAEKNYLLIHPNGVKVEIMFRSCDRPEDVKKFKSLEITGYWIDESIEVSEDIKRMLKNRIGRYPKKSPVRFGIETTNPPDIEHTTYWQFDWDSPPPGPVTDKKPLLNHAGFWQPPRENEPNLRKGYYDDLINDYEDSPDWIAMYVEGKPGMLQRGKLVYANFRRDIHVAANPLIWNKSTLYRGWDNSGNCPACVVIQIPQGGMAQVLREYTTDKQNIVDFTARVVEECNRNFPGAHFDDWGDPAGNAEYSRREGGFTSNAQLMRESGVEVKAAEQNVTARITSVERQLSRIDGILIDPSCIRLINGFLGGYSYKETHIGSYADKPEKNKFSHIHDALQYVLVALFKSQPVERPRRSMQTQAEMTYNPFGG